MKTYKTAIIGCGKRAQHHVPGLLAETRCETVAVVDTNRDAAVAMSGQFGGGPRIYTDHLRMLRQEQPELVIACLWTGLHLPVFRDCVEAGVQLYHSEKPMAPTWGDCLAMAELAETSGTYLTFCHQRRFCAGNRALREMIATGVFGTIRRMDLYSPRNLLDCGTHTFDQALSFNRESPAQWVFGALDTHDPIEFFGVKAEAMAIGFIVFENGVRAHVSIGLPDQEMPTGMRLMGEKGFIEVDWGGQYGRAVVYDHPGWRPPSTAEEDADAGMKAMVADLYDALEHKTTPELDYHKALRATEIIFALYESARRRTRIELPLQSRDNPCHALLDSLTTDEEK